MSLKIKICVNTIQSKNTAIYNMTIANDRSFLGFKMKKFSSKEIDLGSTISKSDLKSRFSDISDFDKPLNSGRGMPSKNIFNSQ